MTPISSMCPASKMVGEPLGLAVAMLLPATSPRTSAKRCASSRHRRAGAASKPEGPGVSRRRLRKAREVSGNMGSLGEGHCVARLGLLEEPRVHDLGQRLDAVHEARPGAAE